MRTRPAPKRETAQELQRIEPQKRKRASAFAFGLAAALAAVAAGCGSEPAPSVPAACLEGPSALRVALTSAPDPVRVAGRRPSECFPRASSQGDVENVGAVFIAAAERLADQARARGSRPRALLELGFLIGAAHRGAARAQGIYAELLRRLDSVPRGLDTQSPAFVRGRRAGARVG